MTARAQSTTASTSAEVVVAVVPRHAATVLVVRDRTDTGGDVPAYGEGPGDEGPGVEGPGVEVLMMRRSATASFLPGAYVFPGGVVDDHDRAVSNRFGGLAPGAAESALGHPIAWACWVAAVRECLEESGLFLGHHASGAPASAEVVREARSALLAGGHSLSGVLERFDLHVALDRLVPWSRWVTPIGSPRRFDTRFFVTRAADVGELSAHEAEMSALRWFAPAEALNDPDVLLITPTASALRLLARARSAADALHAASQRSGLLGAAPRPV